jgi:hypothetical protein
MLVAVIACLVGLVVVIVALARDEPLARPATPDTPPTARSSFPLTSPGYDPAAVEVYLDALARALADLLAGAPPEILERARHLGILHGFDVDTPNEELVQAPAAQAYLSTLGGADPRTDDEALRAEAALVVIEGRAGSS